MREQRTRQVLETELTEVSRKASNANEIEVLVGTACFNVLLDCRELLQKLVEKKSRKVISTEVSMSDSEQKLLDGLDVIES